MSLIRAGLLCCAVALAAPDNKLFEYDRALPFDLQKQSLSPRRDVIVTGASFQTLKGRRADCIIVEPVSPAAKDKRPAVVFQHGGGQSMSNYVAEAVLLAKAGAVSLILEAPYRAEPTERNAIRKGAAQRQFSVDVVIAIRRAIDLLASRPDIDTGRLAFVGHSYGGNAGAVLTSVDKRLKTYVLIGLTARYSRHIAENASGYWQEYRKSLSKEELASTLEMVKSVDPEQYLPASSPAHVLFQCARFDMEDVKQECGRAYEAAGAPKQLRWYDVEHLFADLEASLDRMLWIGETLPVPGLVAVLKSQVDQKVAAASEFLDVLKGAEIERRLGSTRQDQLLLERHNYDIWLRVRDTGSGSSEKNAGADQILHVRKGSGAVTLNGKRDELGPGDFVHISRNTDYQIDARGGRLEYVEVRIFPAGDSSPARQGFLSPRRMPDVLKKAEIDATIDNNDTNQPLHASNGYTMNYVIYAGKPGPWESHQGCVDVYFIQRGTAKAELGGEITNVREQEPGEPRGDGVKGAREYEIAPGDMVHIPRDGVHHMTPHGAKLSYLLLKIWAD